MYLAVRNEALLFWKKEAKNFCEFSDTPPAAYARLQKFFGSFFQKRTASFNTP
jgi:hypothetical protein